MAFPAQTNLRHGLQLDNVSSYLGEDRWKWTAYIKGPADQVRQIQYVEYKLHPTFPNPLVKVNKTEDPRYPFALTRTGWGVFELQAKVVLKNGEEKLLTHMLTFDTTKGATCSEPFELKERHYYRVPWGAFDGRLTAYLGDIHKETKNKPFRLTLFTVADDAWKEKGTLSQTAFRAKLQMIPEDYRWSADLRHASDSLGFRFGGQLYRAEVLALNAAAEKATLQICEER